MKFTNLIKYLVCFLIVLVVFGPGLFMTSQSSYSASVPDHTRGRILLQVEQNGEAWYVHPDEKKRYFMKDGDVAYEMLRQFGLGISNEDLRKIPIGFHAGQGETPYVYYFEGDVDDDQLGARLEASYGTDPNNPDTDGDGYDDWTEIRDGFDPHGSGRLPVDNALINRLKGKILLQVENNGEAWYVHPVEGTRYYLKDGDAAYQVMRFLSLGITDQNLEHIPLGDQTLSIASMEKFSSDEEFDLYLEQLQERDDESDISEILNYGTIVGFGSNFGTPLAAEDSVSSESETITNIQEAGVDEGDIVKAWGDYFIVLRRGRMFTVRIAEAENSTLQTVSFINVTPPGFERSGNSYYNGAWYDEMLMYGNRIVVIGYRYSQNATEVGLFRINPDGGLVHEDTYFIDSDDYYSSRNYASRLVGNQLIFYMPRYLYYSNYLDGKYVLEPRLPEMRRWLHNDEVDDGAAVLHKVSVYKPVQHVRSPTLHSVIRCDLSKENLECEGDAILGPSSRNFYVSPEAVYLWVSQPSYGVYYFNESIMLSEDDKSRSFVYRFGLTDGKASVLRADGSPVDQFSFKEADGYLNVLVHGQGNGESMWNAEYSTGKTALLRTPLSSFSSTPQPLDKSVYTELTSDDGYGFQNRFIGDHVVYGDYEFAVYSDAYTDKRAPLPLAYVYNYVRGGEVKPVQLEHSIERIEVLGDDAVIIGMGIDWREIDPLVDDISEIENGDVGFELSFSSIILHNAPHVKDVYTIPEASQGEFRSHGFFFKQDANKTGMIGIPVRRSSTRYGSFSGPSSEVLFLNVSSDRRFSDMGSLVSGEGNRPDDNCSVSCVDWYGNSRPIFYGDRIFGLMGYEFVEGEKKSGRISEVQRIDFTPVINRVADESAEEGEDN